MTARDAAVISPTISLHYDESSNRHGQGGVKVFRTNCVSRGWHQVLILGGILALAVTTTAGADTVRLGNEPWPPFVIEGEQQGTAEAIVCEALSRGGHDCAMAYNDWPSTLEAARTGAVDGIAAAWFTPERGQDLLFSTSYLTNRLVPVTRDGDAPVRGLEDLAGRNVALEAGFAYGEALLAARASFAETLEVTGGDALLAALREGRADVAVVDELTADQARKAGATEGLVIGEVALAYRELHFAMSRAYSEAQAVVADFNQAYQSMLRDGSVNRILGMEWLATDLGDDGVMDFIHAGDLQAAVADAASSDRVYALEQDDFEAIRDPGFIGSNANYLAEDTAYQTPEAAMKALDTGRRCSYDSASARIVCTGR